MKEPGKIKHRTPTRSPIDPVRLQFDDEIRFDCHKGVTCFNACCKNIDVTITPYDILRLKRRLGMTSSGFVNEYTTPFPMDHHNMPGLKLNSKPGTTECIFLAQQGCDVYEDRPAACRYYALGSMGARMKDSDHVEDIFFLVKEPHCMGHNEPRTLTVREYRKEQGCEQYDEMNREWRDIIIKKRSSGPTVGAPSERSLQLFDMCSYDMDSFREFIRSPGFDQVFDISADEKRLLLADEDALLRFAMRFLKQVLFGEMTIKIREDAEAQRLARRQKMKTRHKARKSL